MAAGVRSLLAFWAGGASAAPASTQAGVRGPLAFWLGGASAPSAATQGGVRGLLAFWLGGASAGAAAEETPSQGGGGLVRKGYWPGLREWGAPEKKAAPAREVKEPGAAERPAPRFEEPQDLGAEFARAHARLRTVDAEIAAARLAAQKEHAEALRIGHLHLGAEALQARTGAIEKALTVKRNNLLALLLLLADEIV